MLRNMILVLIMNILLFNSNVFAEKIEYYNYMSKEGNPIRLEDSIITMGDGYIKWVRDISSSYTNYDVFYSSDKKTWVNIEDEEIKKAFMAYFDGNNNLPTCELTTTDKYIIVKHRETGLPFNMSMDRVSSMYILNRENFKFIKKYIFDNSTGLTSYVDGVFYITKYMSFYSDDPKDIPYEVYRTVKEQKTYSTTDFENWTEYSSDGSIPITNGKTTILAKNSLIKAENGTNFYAQRNIEPQHIYIHNDDVNKEVKYEAVDVAQIFPVRELYIGIPSTYEKSLQGKFLVSNDGIYFNTVDLPGKNENLYMMSEAKDDMVLCSINSYERCYQGLEYMFCSYSKLKRLAFDSQAYVQLDDKILGFSQPPVMEDDRTLVPMRFLFEQMGADVNWNDATQTATATIDSARGGGGSRNRAGDLGLAIDSKAKPLVTNTTGESQNSVTFSIDNTTATVNGEAAAMDVPARLINDQTFVPLRFLSENLGYNVEWDESTNTAIITTN